MPEDVAGIVSRTEHLVGPILDESGLELVDVEYVFERGRWILRILADREGGITLDECARASREIGDLLDAEDVLRHGYVLEVSSPGLNRPLKKDAHFSAVVGQKVRIQTRQPFGGRRNFEGRLVDFREHTAFVEVEGQVVELPVDQMRKAHLVYEFDR